MTQLKDKTGNQINVIYPYRTAHGWSFDDPEVGLMREPFVCGTERIIDNLVGDVDKFVAYISHSPIPYYHARLTKIDDRDGIEGWYRLGNTDMVGWLCPATLKYFKDYPDDIYIKIELL